MSDAKNKLSAFDDNDEIMSWCDRDTYEGSETYVHLHGLYGLAVEFSDEITALRADNERLRTRVRELEGQHKGLVLNNAILRERPDLPLNRIPAARAMTKLYEENERLRAALEQIAEGSVSDHPPTLWAFARAALDGQPAPGKEEA